MEASLLLTSEGHISSFLKVKCKIKKCSRKDIVIDLCKWLVYFIINVAIMSWMFPTEVIKYCIYPHKSLTAIGALT